MEGMEIGRVLLFFSFQYCRRNFSCALRINWFVHDEPDRDTGMWTVQMERDMHDMPGQPTVEVIDIDSIPRGVHLLPVNVYGSSRVPNDFSHHDALNSFNPFLIEHYIDYNTQEVITMTALSRFPGFWFPCVLKPKIIN